MFMHIVTQLSGRITALYTQVLASLKAQLCKLVSSLRVSFIRGFQNVRNLYLLNLLRVQTVSSFNRFRVSLITAVQLIKAGLSTVKAKLIQLGQQLATIAHQILQHVTTTYKKSKELVAKIKSVLSHISVSKTVLIHTVRQLIQAGLKSLETARQRLQHVQRRLFKGR